MPLTDSQLEAERENFVCSFEKETEFDDYEDSMVDIICGEFETICNRPPSMGEIVSILTESSQTIRSSQGSDQAIFAADFDAAKVEILHYIH